MTNSTQSTTPRRVPGKWVVIVGGVLVLVFSAWAITLINKRARMGPRPPAAADMRPGAGSP